MHGYKLACVALIQMECSASKERVVARVAHHWRTRIRHAALRLPTKARTTLQRFDLFAPGLQRGRERNGLSSALCKRDAWQERPRCGACLRTRFARFCGKANHSRGLCFICRCNASRVDSSDANRLSCLDFRDSSPFPKYVLGRHPCCMTRRREAPRAGFGIWICLRELIEK